MRGDRHAPATPSPGVYLLDGVRVVDFSHVHAGPLCAYQLALMGADVVKVESPAGGDQMRAGHPQGLPPVFLGQNANKRSLAIDLKAPAPAEGRSRALSQLPTWCFPAVLSACARP